MWMMSCVRVPGPVPVDGGVLHVQARVGDVRAVHVPVGAAAARPGTPRRGVGPSGRRRTARPPPRRPATVRPGTANPRTLG